jgi:ABC-2 type transport system permease protein
MGLFALLGAKRTRLASQIVAAIVGAAFAIGIQLVSIVSYGNLSRISAFHSSIALRYAPNLDSLIWLPAKGALGDVPSAIAVIVASIVLLAAVTALCSGHFGRFATAAAGIEMSGVRQRRGRRRLFRGGAAAMLRQKEWALLARDPWLASQTLMQLLYLLPPALLLWRSYSSDGGSMVLFAPVLVMAAGQLAGGLAWLAISGEDAPELIATAPVAPALATRAKIEAVIAAVAVPVTPFVVALAPASPWIASVTAIGVAAAAGSATAIQILFRSQAKRAFFRRRQTSSRAATFAEAFSSINWAATAALAAAGSWISAAFALVSILVLYGAYLISPASRRLAQGQ